MQISGEDAAGTLFNSSHLRAADVTSIRLLQVVDDIIKTTGNRQVEFMKLDLASFKSIRAFAEELDQPGHRVDKLHVLVNNAGVALGAQDLTGMLACERMQMQGISTM